MIKLSIIIPVFNAEKTLRRCLDSVLQQKDDELEIVVINDGSKDSSDKIIKEYKEKLSLLIENVTYREKLSQAAFQYVKQYDSEIITEQWIQLFQKVRKDLY